MIPPQSFLLRYGLVAWFGSFFSALPSRLHADGGTLVSTFDAGPAAAVSALLAGLVVWLVTRRRLIQAERSARQTVRQMSSLIEHADCLLWEARVVHKGEAWSWSFVLHPSLLSRQLFGDDPPPPEVGLWYKFEIPERAEMDRRSREAMLAGERGYEQQFPVTRGDGQVTWLDESVSITTTGPNQFRLIGLATDITARRAAEMATRSSQEKLQQLLSHANCMLWQANVTRDETDAYFWQWFVPSSELYRRVAGDDAGKRAIMPWGLVNVPEFPEMEARSRDAMARGLTGYEQIFRVIHGSEMIWMHEQAAITRLGPDQWRIEGVVMDITAQRRAEEAQRTSEKRLRYLLERADCMIWQGRVTAQPDGELVWNVYSPPSQLYRRIYGDDSDAFRGFDWKRLSIPEFEEMLRRANDAVAGGASGYDQVFHVPRSDRTIWLSEQVSITAAGPGEWDLVGTITDITARHEAEEARRASDAQLKKVLELANCMVWYATVTESADGNFIWAMTTQPSVLYRRLFGENDTESVLDWRQLNVPEFEEMQQRFADAFRSGAPGYEQVFRVISPMQVNWLHETVTVVRAGGGEVRLVGVITDITAQREALEVRRASEQQVQQMLATADCLLWQARVFKDESGELQWVLLIPASRLYREVFGTEPTNPPELLWPRVIDAVTIREMNARSSQAILSGAADYEQEFMADREGRSFWLHEQVTIAKVGDGEWRLVGVITDMTARRNAEQLVRASEVRYRSLFQHTPVAIVETDFRRVGQRLDELRRNGVTDLEAWLAQDERRVDECARLVGVIDTNETAVRMFRAKRRSDFRRRRNLLSTPDAMRVLRSTLLALWEGRNTLEAQLEMRDFGGGLRHMNVRWWVAQTETGLDLRQSVLVFVDLTELKQAEAALATEKERLAVTLRAMTEGVVTTDMHGIIQFINPAAGTLTEWESEAIGQQVGKICVFENDRAGSVFEFPMDDVVTDLPAQTRLITRTGRHRLVDGCCAPIHSSDSRVIGMVFVFRDVTEHERLEQELVRATRLESVGVLAGGIAHDFNNILTGVMGNLALAQLDIDGKSDVGLRLREAEKAALRARDLTQQLLTFAKGGEPIRTAVHLGTIVQETATFALHGSNVRPVFHLAPDLWRADADKGQIGRVVQNLVINAIQAMPAGGTLRLTVSNEKISGLGQPGLAPGHYVKVTIADTGEGIKQEDLSRIFDPYFTTKQSGSGLGLAAVYSIIKKHRGYVDVESTLGRGTTFRIWLPALYDSQASTVAPMPVAGTRFAGRILFMDDEESIRRMAALMLQRVGFEVETVADGAEAVARFRAERTAGTPFTLVVMDLTVPGGMGGREAIIQLQGIDPAVKAIVSSGYSSDPVLANYQAYGFCGVVEKPYQMDDLIRVLRDVLPTKPR